MAANRSGRPASSVTLIAVSKGQPREKIIEAIEVGQRDFGENYAQELMDHAGAGRTQGSPLQDIRWHFIGHLQRNKVKVLLPHVTLIHSIDSLPLAQEIDKRAASLDRVASVLIEVNLGGEASKSGIAENEVKNLIRSLKELPHVDLKGLMVLPPFETNPEKSRPFFRRLREIRDAINRQNVYKHPLSELSMGMTYDFEVAIEEGATIIRVGTGIFGEREKKQ